MKLVLVCVICQSTHRAASDLDQIETERTKHCVLWVECPTSSDRRCPHQKPAKWSALYWHAMRQWLNVSPTRRHLRERNLSILVLVCIEKGASVFQHFAKVTGHCLPIVKLDLFARGGVTPNGCRDDSKAYQRFFHHIFCQMAASRHSEPCVRWSCADVSAPMVGRQSGHASITPV